MKEAIFFSPANPAYSETPTSAQWSSSSQDEMLRLLFKPIAWLPALYHFLNSIDRQNVLMLQASFTDTYSFPLCSNSHSGNHRMNVQAQFSLSSQINIFMKQR